ncbi:alpha-L-fucosidase [Kitasatospora sp. NPDC059327]|uniref:alpha-L-fucosidase n=1 Tax=Kitasatospora sp. NPDC059327 TaxID=3346803 RepID=UPI00369B74B7
MSSSPYEISRRGLLGAAGAATAFGLLRFAPEASATEGPQGYTATWSSVNQHPAVPEWFQDGKFGIYSHWGVFSVPAFYDEWYPRTMYNSKQVAKPERPVTPWQHHVATYGDPSVWPYHNFIDGARDKAGNFVQFAPKLASQGGEWDPEAWARLYKAAGAKFAGMVAEHHDGYSMWPSRCNPWNSVDRGPKLDIVGLQAKAIRGQGLKLVTSLHHAFHLRTDNRFFAFAPRQSDPTLRILYGQLSAAERHQLWSDKLIEVIDGCQPDMIWQDFGVGDIPESERLRFLAHYFNMAVAGNKDVVATYKGTDLSGGSSVYDFERGGPAGLLSPFWLTDDSVSSSSWCYTEGIGYYPTRAMLHSLIDRVSKGGALLLNIAPKADGSIPSEQQSILLGMGDWLRRFGEALYATRAWTCYGEGPTQMGNGTFTPPKAGTARDVRFARSKDNRVLYATALGWQGATMTIGTLNSNRINLGNLTRAQLLDNTTGTYIDLPAPTQDGAGLHLTMPTSNPPFDALAYSVKLTFSGQIPTLDAPAGPVAWVKITHPTTGLVLDSGGPVAAMSKLKQWKYDGSAYLHNLQWQLTPVGDGYYRITNRKNGMAIDSRPVPPQIPPVPAPATPVVTQAPWDGSHEQQWMFNNIRDNHYEIINRANGMAIDGNGKTVEGSDVLMRPPAAAISDKRDWIITGI